MKLIKFIIFFGFLAAVSVDVVRGQGNAAADGFKKTAEEFRSRSDPDNAIVYYEKAAMSFSDSGDTERTIDSYNQIGALLNRQDKFEKAKDYLERALTVGNSSKEPNSLAISATHLHLGVAYGAENQFEQSLLHHNKALSIRLSKLGKIHADVATSYGNIGNVYLRMKDYKKAVEAHQTAKEIREKLHGKDSAEVVESYRSLGNTYREKKDYKEALSFFEKSLQNKIRQLGDGHKDLARYYKLISEVHGLMGDKAKADEYRLKAEEVEKK